MSKAGNRFGGILAAIGNRFLGTPQTERGSIFSTAAAQTDFLDSLPLAANFAAVRFSARGAARRPADDDLSLPAGRAHGKPLSLAAAGRADGLHGAGANGHLSARPAADPVHDGGIRDARPHGNHGARGGVFSGLWRQAVGRAAGHDPAPALLQEQLGNLPRQCRLIQCFANGDQSTLDYIARRLERLVAPFELRTAFSRQRFSQLLMIEGEPPAAAIRLEHEDVAAIRAQIGRRTRMIF